MDDMPPKVLYRDSAARHVDARASASAHKNAEGSMSVLYMGVIYTFCGSKIKQTT
jgi:hypothetical protein